MLENLIAALRHESRQFLTQQTQPQGEYALLQHLQHVGLFEFLEAEPFTLQLFKKHFLVMHVLYQLRSDFATCGWQLNISPLAISLEVISRGVSLDNNNKSLCQEDSSADAALADFYGDLNFYHQATLSNVDALLNQFWQAYARYQDAGDAFAVLELPSTANWADVQVAYRRLAQQHHPDKQGDAAAFANIASAYALLKKRLQNT